MENEEDYKPHTHLHIVLLASGRRCSLELNDDQAKNVGVFLSECAFGVFDNGNIRIWMTGSLEYVGPPERSPELKYQNKS